MRVPRHMIALLIRGSRPAARDSSQSAQAVVDLGCEDFPKSLGETITKPLGQLVKNDQVDPVSAIGLRFTGAAGPSQRFDQRSRSCTLRVTFEY